MYKSKASHNYAFATAGRLLFAIIIVGQILGYSSALIPQPLASAVDRYHTEAKPVQKPYEQLNKEVSTDIVIVGGGLAGLALLMGIATNCPDTSVMLVEKRHSYVRAGAILGIAANGAKALDELAGEKSEIVRKLQSRGKDMSPIENVPIHLLPWWVVRDALLERSRELAETSGERVIMCNGLELNSIEEMDDGRAELRFSNAPECRVTTKLVVGADGVRSNVRTLLGLPPAEHTGKSIWRGVIQIDEVEDKHDRSVIETISAKGPTYFLKNDGESFVAVFNEIMPGLLVWQIQTSLTRDEEISSFLASIDDDEDSKSLDALIRRTPHIVYTELLTMNMDHISEDADIVQGWGGSRCTTLIGDAAHACRPTDGQGANMAFEDACILVRRLKEKNILDEDFVSGFENERRSRVKIIHQDQAERALKQGKDWTRWPEAFMKWVYDGV